MPVPENREPLPEAPSAMDLLDPAPYLPPEPPPSQADESLIRGIEERQQDRPKRNAPRRKGPVELAVLRDLKAFPDDLRQGGIAAAALRMAMELDAGIVLGRDAAGHAREIRQCLVQLREFAPGEVRGDATDEIRERREKRLAQG